jgi:hypothetical protein
MSTRTRQLAVALVLCWIIGGGCRWLAMTLQSPQCSQIAGMVLFAPMVTAVLWVAWQVPCSSKSLAIATLVAVATFAAWNAVMLNGFSHPESLQGLRSNAVHWCLYAGFGWFSAKYCQWGIGIAIYDRRQDEGRSSSPGRLSIGKLGALVILTALLMAIHVQFNLPQTSSHRVMMAEEFRWYELFPMQSKPVVSGILGGCLLGCHWTAVALCSQAWFGWLKLVGLAGWIAFATALRWSFQRIYWMSESEILQQWLARPTTPIGQSSDPYTWMQAALEAVIQIGLIGLSFGWLQRLGFRFAVCRNN